MLSNSGTSSLLVALQTLKEFHGWQDGDEVIVPALTFVATVNVVLQTKLKPVLVDVESNYYGIEATLIEQAITPRTRAIIPVHTFGQPCDMTSREYTKAVVDNGLRVIEDSCETMFAKHSGLPVGSWSDIACFSTYMAHLITTGVGGIATTNNPDYTQLMRSLCNHGMSYEDLSPGDAFNPQRIRRDFVFDRVGHSFRITEFEAAMGLAQLETWDEMITQRQHNAAYLYMGLESLIDRLQLPSTRPDTTHSFMMFPLVCRRSGTRDNLMRYLEECGIETRRMLPLTCQPVYWELFNEDDYPVAKWINNNGLYIGCHQNLMVDDLDYVIEKIGAFFNGR